ncbi:MAG: hypothetical protein KAI51_03025, partial [Candidatus Aenigmarchaeota archaeon]|nr:hypothetical protein [Candidatus Aenigmarchaeota archaeon]
MQRYCTRTRERYRYLYINIAGNIVEQDGTIKRKSNQEPGFPTGCILFSSSAFFFLFFSFT